MPLFIPALWGALISILSTLVGRVLASAGIGFVAYKGLDVAMTWAKSQFLAGIGGLPAAAVAMAGTLKVGTCVSMLLSAYTARLILQGMTGGAIKKVVHK